MNWIWKFFSKKEVTVKSTTPNNCFGIYDFKLTMLSEDELDIIHVAIAELRQNK